MAKWFTKCKYAEQGKDLYRELVKKYHTDNGAQDDSIIKEINAEFSEWWKTHKHLHYSEENQSEYTKDTTETVEDFIEIIRNLSTLPGLTVEQIGRWLWITGNTFPVREQLKTFGCRWSSGKKQWYWTKEPYHNYSSHKSFGRLRSQYGSHNVELGSPVLLS